MASRPMNVYTMYYSFYILSSEATRTNAPTFLVDSAAPSLCAMARKFPRRNGDMLERDTAPGGKPRLGFRNALIFRLLPRVPIQHSTSPCEQSALWPPTRHTSENTLEADEIVRGVS